MIFRVLILGFTCVLAFWLGWNRPILEGTPFYLYPSLLYPSIIFLVGLVLIGLEVVAHRAEGRKILFASIGLLLGLGIGEFTAPLFGLLVFEPKLGFIFQALVGYVGFTLGWLKEEEIQFLTFSQKGETNPVSHSYKILDTSSIIDGRIADISETGFLEGTLIVPKFVLNELHQVADSADPLKRSRGRRGLDILNNLKASKYAIIKITEEDFEDTPAVDSKLLKLALQYGNAVVVTNDFNLNKVAAFQGVSILNINELANAVKPVLLPNEELRITVIKEGKDQNQGIAYLEDGTMIVVDNGKNYIGREIKVVVTSILQTPAGRMIFTQLSHAENRSTQPAHS